MPGFISLVEINVTADATWRDFDLSSSIPSNAVAVLVMWVNTSATSYDFGLRCNGSTSTIVGNDIAPDRGFMICALDGNKILEAYRQNANVKMYVYGYLTSDEAVVNVNNTLISFSAGAWTDYDLNVNAGAIGALIRVSNGVDTPNVYGARKNGSSDARLANLSGSAVEYFMIGLDANEICELYKSTNMTMGLIGYIKTNAVFNTNATDISLSSTGNYYDLSALPTTYGAPVASIIELYGASSSYAFNMRKNGDTTRFADATWYQYEQSRHQWIVAECATDGIVEAKIANAALDFFLTGYFYNSINVSIKIDGTWKLANGVWVNVGGVWKAISDLAKGNIGGVWK